MPKRCLQRCAETQPGRACPFRASPVQQHIPVRLTGRPVVFWIAAVLRAAHSGAQDAAFNTGAGQMGYEAGSICSCEVSMPPAG